MSFSVKLDSKSVDNAEKSVRESFNKVINNQVLLKELGETIITDIKFQTRKGKFKPLSKDWIAERKQIAKATATAQSFSPARSNLTLTGQLIDSLKILTAKAGNILIGFAGIHTPYKAQYRKSWYRIGAAGKKTLITSNKSGVRTIGARVANEDLAKYVAEQGRDFVKVRPTLIPVLKQKVINYIRRSSRVLGLFK
jgi:hypothetical protein